MLQVWSSIEDVAGPQLRTKIGVIEVKMKCKWLSLRVLLPYSVPAPHHQASLPFR